MGSSTSFLADLVKESATDIAFEEALSLISAEELEKIAAIMPPGTSGMLAHVTGQAMHGAAHAPLRTMGALAGGAYGALSDPGIDPQTGQPNGRLGNMAAGAIGGAVIGHGLKAGAGAVRSMPGQAGSFVRNAQTQAALSSKNMKDKSKSLKSLAKAREGSGFSGHAPSAPASAPVVAPQPQPSPQTPPPSGPVASQYASGPRGSSLVGSAVKERAAAPKQMEMFKGSAAEGNALANVAKYVAGHAHKAADYVHKAGVGGAAVGGAALGAAKNLVDPGKDQYGQDKDRIGAMVGGAAKGAVGGALLHQGIKHYQPAIKGKQTFEENSKNIYHAAKKHLSNLAESAKE